MASSTPGRTAPAGPTSGGPGSDPAGPDAALVPKLWTCTIDAVKRELRRLSFAHGGTPARLRYAKVAEFQARGAVHLHALVRLDGADPADPDAILPPPSWATAELLNRLLIEAARSTAIRTPAHSDQPEGWVIQWGAQVRPLTVARGLPGAEVTEQHVAGYLAKYATKATEAAGHLSTRLTESTVRLYADSAKHTGWLIAAAWNLGRPAAGPGWSRLRPWAHMLGFGGHFATKSRAYSTTFGALRGCPLSNNASGQRLGDLGPTRAATAGRRDRDRAGRRLLDLRRHRLAYHRRRRARPCCRRRRPITTAGCRPPRRLRGRRLTMDATQERMWTPDDVSAYLQVPVQTLYQWRKGFGPQARRVGKHLRWNPAAVRAWFEGLDH